MNWRTPEQAKEEVFIPPFKQYSVVRRARVGDCGESSLLRATGGAMRCFEEALEYARAAFIRLDDQGHIITEAIKQKEARMLKTVRQGVFSINCLRYLQSAHSLHAGAPEPHPRKFESRRSHRERSCDALPDARTSAGIGQHYRSEEHTSELQSHLNLVCRL